MFLTTHYLQEADSLCDRLAIIDGGKIVAEGTPTALKQQIVGDVLTFRLEHPERALEPAQQLLREQACVRETKSDQAALYVYVDQGEEALVSLLRRLEDADIAVQSAALTRPSLDDVFLQKTGRSLSESTASVL
ncbi:ATP-binding protein DrrA1-3 family domain-containing protein [Dictyobacter vulcani]|uniref:ATP-binding protein DrrA1-3 family domain-containing protein n=1 Tax=Dictyobacter vulcani TaxID=2607529 RepID=UPI0018E9C306|nr:DUF4162 domain-containing protein [Dictyobacter vulcani]